MKSKLRQIAPGFLAGVPYKTVIEILRRGWTEAEALSKPVRAWGRDYTPVASTSSRIADAVALRAYRAIYSGGFFGVAPAPCANWFRMVAIKVKGCSKNLSIFDDDITGFSKAAAASFGLNAQPFSTQMIFITTGNDSQPLASNNDWCGEWMSVPPCFRSLSPPMKQTSPEENPLGLFVLERLWHHSAGSGVALSFASSFAR